MSDGAPRLMRFDALAMSIRHRPARCGATRLVAIDGPGGAGKSAFARRLAKSLDDAPIVQTDDFASWDEPLDWWARLETEVLGPLERGTAIRFQAYDWDVRRLGAWRELPASDVVILEGVSSSRRAVAERLTSAVWVEAPPAVRLARGIARDGEAMRPAWERWMAEEDRHFAADGGRGRASVIVDGAPDPPMDLRDAFVVLGGAMVRP